MAQIVTIGEKENKQAAFIRLYVETGDCQQAALGAGYSHGEYGYQLRDKLAHEIREAMDKRIAAVAPMAMNTLTTLAMNAESESVKRQAAKDIMSLGGFDVKRTEDLTDRRDTRTDEQLMAALADMAKGDMAFKAQLSAVVNDGAG